MSHERRMEELTIARYWSRIEPWIAGRPKT